MTKRAYSPSLPEFTRVHAERLRALARHLSYGKLSKVVFDFARVNRGKDPALPFPDSACGYAGCALGEFHKVFPAEFGGQYYVGISATVDKFLGITEYEARHLFVPNFQDPCIPGDKLPIHATRFQVAANIRKFIKHKGF